MADWAFAMYLFVIKRGSKRLSFCASASERCSLLFGALSPRRTTWRAAAAAVPRRGAGPGAASGSGLGRTAGEGRRAGLQLPGKPVNSQQKSRGREACLRRGKKPPTTILPFFRCLSSVFSLVPLP